MEDFWLGYGKFDCQKGSALKAEINFWEEDVAPTVSEDDFNSFVAEIDSCSGIQEASLCDDSAAVATTIGGYVARKLDERFSCKRCKKILLESDDPRSSSYLDTLSRGGLITPSNPLCDFTCNAFAVLDYSDSIIQKHSSVILERLC